MTGFRSSHKRLKKCGVQTTDALRALSVEEKRAVVGSAVRHMKKTPKLMVLTPVALAVVSSFHPRLRSRCLVGERKHTLNLSYTMQRRDVISPDAPLHKRESMPLARDRLRTYNSARDIGTSGSVLEKSTSFHQCMQSEL